MGVLEMPELTRSMNIFSPISVDLAREPATDRSAFRSPGGSKVAS